MGKISLLAFITAFLLVTARSEAQNDVLADIHNLHKSDVEFQGFVLDEPQVVSIDVVAASRKIPLWTRAWILNSDTREVVWEIHHTALKDDDRNSKTYSDTLSLPKGTYEVYYASFPYNFYNVNGFSDFMDFLGDKFFNWSDGDDFSHDYRDFLITVKGKGTHLDNRAIEKIQEAYRKNSLFSMSGLWDNQYEKQGFVLSKPTDLEIYAIGELRSNGAFDYGWIKDVKNDKVVWTMMNRDLDRAGGDKKNRMIKETISLPAGTYAAFFVTDDSHSSREWNAPPPYDPEFWGMTVRAARPEMKENVMLYTYENAPTKNIIAELTRVRDKEFRSKGFTLNRGMDVRVLAIGEGTDGEMVDYGWIMDANSNKKVWEMKYFDTQNAGGATKNRMIDKIIHLDKGSYVVNYVSDGSHNYGDWNAAPPFDPDHWGITLMSADDKFASTDVAPYDDDHAKSILARIIRVGDDERKHKDFTLDKDTQVRIYALGEGRDGEMYDYGWIEDANTGRTVWEMTYRMTEPAGGAEKNRRFDGSIVLKAGEYVVRYQSDGSHSFDGWNDDPPPDPYNWGITLYNADSKISDN
ncbi:MAG TPA: hypothetical protein VMM58_01835 [Bacteroidota bacterium]|nr:hypothetical protein [Bacteroidota bacterium]